MRKRRTFFFLASILLGGLVGIGYGWWLRPQMYSNADLSNLREDFQADYVLMTAEIFHYENDAEDARSRLRKIGSSPPEQYTGAAILTAGQLGYGQTDLQMLADLNLAFLPVTQTPAEVDNPQP